MHQPINNVISDLITVSAPVGLVNDSNVRIIHVEVRVLNGQQYTEDSSAVNSTIVRLHDVRFVFRH